MPPAIAAVNTLPPLDAARPGSAEKGELRRQFDAAIAGTFYRQMLQSLRKMHSQPAYFHGGRAEEIFRNQIDEQVADDLAQEHGRAFTDPLFEQFASRR